MTYVSQHDSPIIKSAIPIHQANLMKLENKTESHDSGNYADNLEAAHYNRSPNPLALNTSTVIDSLSYDTQLTNTSTSNVDSNSNHQIQEMKPELPKSGPNRYHPRNHVHAVNNLNNNLINSNNNNNNHLENIHNYYSKQSLDSLSDTGNSYHQEKEIDDATGVGVWVNFFCEVTRVTLQEIHKKKVRKIS